MNPQAALALAIVSCALAVGIVAVDLSFGLHAELQDKAMDYETVASDGGDGRVDYPFRCASPDLRLVVHNDWVFAADVPVTITVYDYSEGRTITLLDDTWHMKAGDRRSYDFTVPPTAFENPDGSTAVKVSNSVNAQVADMYLGVCVEGDA